MEVSARMGDAPQSGLMFVPFHFGSRKKEAANELTAGFVDLLSKQSPFKQSACKIEKIRRKHKVAAYESLDFFVGQYSLSAEDLKDAKINISLKPFMPYRQKI